MVLFNSNPQEREQRVTVHSLSIGLGQYFTQNFAKSISVFSNPAVVLQTGHHDNATPQSSRNLMGYRRGERLRAVFGYSKWSLNNSSVSAVPLAMNPQIAKQSLDSEDTQSKNYHPHNVSASDKKLPMAPMNLIYLVGEFKPETP